VPDPLNFGSSGGAVFNCGEGQGRRSLGNAALLTFLGARTGRNCILTNANRKSCRASYESADSAKAELPGDRLLSVLESCEDKPSALQK
jgi:hypothetical protein